MIFLFPFIHYYVIMSSLLAPLYYPRLVLNPDKLDPTPTLTKLCRIVEAHLQHIPFENLAQHGAIGGKPTLDTTVTAHKVLTRRRGGFCMELNGLLSVFLQELGYRVTLVPAHVYAGKEQGGFIPAPTHVFLIVQTQVDENDEKKEQKEATKWLVDVGFGEPALQPLRYELSLEQRTPEGMISRVVPLEEPEETSSNQHELSSNHNLIDQPYWQLQYKLGNEWVPRLKWKMHDALLPPEEGATMDEFRPAMERTLDPSSIFSQKLICCRITRDEKITLAGNKLKRTGPPRFASEEEDDSEPKSVTTELASIQQVREILRDEFGIPFHESSGLDLSKSLKADPAIWSQL